MKREEKKVRDSVCCAGIWNADVGFSFGLGGRFTGAVGLGVEMRDDDMLYTDTTSLLID